MVGSSPNLDFPHHTLSSSEKGRGEKLEGEGGGGVFFLKGGRRGYERTPKRSTINQGELLLLRAAHSLSLLTESVGANTRYMYASRRAI